MMKCQSDLKELPLAVSAKERAGLLGISVRHVRRMDSSGQLPAPVRLGGAVRWLTADIKNWLDSGAPDRKIWNQIKETSNAR